MSYHAKNESLLIGDTTMDYVTFGSGKKTLIIVPGVGDGLKSVRGMAVPFSVMYHAYTKEYTVYMFSRKNKLKENCTIHDMAFDLKVAMEILGIKKADMMGISQGGMILQHFTLHYPEKVGKLVLAVTLPRVNECLRGVIAHWIGLAEEGKHHELILDNAYKMYTEDFVQKNKWLLPAVSSFCKPESFERFIIMAKACLDYDCYDQLDQIHVPTLVVGGELDQVVDAQPSRDIAEKIPGSRLVMFEHYGHAVYVQAKEFHTAVMEFLTEEKN